MQPRPPVAVLLCLLLPHSVARTYSKQILSLLPTRTPLRYWRGCGGMGSGELRREWSVVKRTLVCWWHKVWFEVYLCYSPYCTDGMSISDTLQRYQSTLYLTCHLSFFFKVKSFSITLHGPNIIGFHVPNLLLSLLFAFSTSFLLHLL